ncbi:MAG: hypothetical protein ACK4E0_01360 [Chitinophagaceae bacterium]
MLRYASIFLTCLLLAACSRDESDVNGFSCAELQAAVVSNDLAMMKRVVEPLMASLSRPSSFAHGQNQLETVAAFLNECASTEASLLCFECIYTLPAQSEILIKVQTGSGSLSKVVDISRDKNGVLRVVNIHD